ncbi:FHA domain-containing protein [Geodermatophilus tzadiensis]|uniref:FHA domain-containing protein n=1 Tax=Geodermatophilus tzadiensis TaxID=1137988 RepID=A0A2T0TWP4_9ACTN|nr:FHA domain-containing protein [Geodermatophilus tzadiensis]PRY50122.1 FHA domain-containing protein [Geodermatophilus tzadiensis]
MPQTRTTRVGLAPGDGLVARFGDVVLLVPEDGTDAGELLDLVEAAAAEDEPGSALATRLLGWAGGRRPGEGPAFGVVAPVADGVVVLLRGGVSAEVTGPAGTRRLSGRQALTWVDHVVALPFERVTVGDGDAPAHPHPRSALREGVVPARGFVLSPAGDLPTGDHSTDDAPAHAAPARDAPAHAAPAHAAAPTPTLPASVPEPAPAADDAPLEETLVARAEDVPTAGAGAERRSDPLETALAPAPVGALVCDGGPTVVLDRAYVLGREPQNDPDVQRAVASPVVIRDPGNLVSRVHARVEVDDGRVWVRDAPSVSGTYVAGPGASEWTRIGTGPTLLPPDWSLRIGTQVFTFRTTKAAADVR